MRSGGPAPGEAALYAAPTRPYLDELDSAPEPLRIGFSTAAWGSYGMHSMVADRLTQAASLCEELGHEVVEVVPAIDFDEFYEAFSSNFSVGAVPFVDAVAAAMGRSAGPDTLEPVILSIYEHGKEFSAAELTGFLAVANKASRTMGRFFLEHDVLLTPVLAAPPPALGTCHLDQPGLPAAEYYEQIWRLIPYTPLCNFTGAPAISVPLCETDEGCPVGMHFISDIGREDTLIRLAGQLETARPWAHRRPAVHVANGGRAASAGSAE